MANCETRYDMLPAHMQSAARRYIEEHRPVGGFLTAVLENNLVLAFGLADEDNLAAMREWAAWLYMEVPRVAWGSPEEVRAWLAQGNKARPTEGA